MTTISRPSRRRGPVCMISPRASVRKNAGRADSSGFIGNSGLKLGDFDASPDCRLTWGAIESMERVYAPAGVADGAIALDRDEAHHLVRVRRVGVGDQVVAFDGLGQSWLCRLGDVGKNAAWLEVIAPAEPDPGAISLPEVWIGTAVPKGDRFDWLVEKATELGVARIVPLACERSVVEPRSTKLDRLRRTVIEACKQCGRNRLAEITEPVPLKSFLSERTQVEVGLFADRGGAWLGEIMAARDRPIRIRVCVGPEGGWTEAERSLAASHGWQPVCFGPHVLRIETAAIAAAAAVWQAMAGQSHSGREVSS